MTPKIKVITVYIQDIEVFIDGKKRIKPIYLRPVDRKTFNTIKTVFTDETKYRVESLKIEKPYVYEWTPKDVKPKIEVKHEYDVKPWIKCEIKDFKPFLKTELKFESKFETKKEFSNDNKMLSEDMPSSSDECLSCEPPLKKIKCFDDLSQNNGSNSSDNESYSEDNRSVGDFEDEFNISDVDEDTNESFAPLVQSDPHISEDLSSTQLTDIESDNDEDLTRNSFSSDVTDVYDYTEIERRQSMARFEPQLRTRLYELILSHMSLKDKLKTECVSKEWQTIMISKQESLIIQLHYKKKHEMIGKNAILLANKTNFAEYSQKLIAKFPNLTEIQILGRNSTNINPIVDRISERLLHLQSVVFRGIISRDVLLRFGMCFGSNLKSIDINYGDYCLKNEELIESLLSFNLRTVSVNTGLESLTLNVLPHLRELLDVDIHNIEGLKLMADHYRQQITKISFSQTEPTDYPNDKSIIKKTLKQLSRFNRLEYLDFYYSDHHLKNGFLPIVRKCTELKELHVFGYNSHFSLELLNSFPKLKVLGLFFDCKNDSTLNFSSLEALQLTELWMYCDIGPNELFKILEKMKSLRTLHIKSNLCWQKQIEYIIQSDNSLTTIYLEDVLITPSTVGALINKAIKRPKIQYNMFSDVYNPKEKCLTGCKRIERPEFPPNLTLIVEKETKDPFGSKRRLPKKQKVGYVPALYPVAFKYNLKPVNKLGKPFLPFFLKDHNYSKAWKSS